MLMVVAMTLKNATDYRKDTVNITATHANKSRSGKPKAAYADGQMYLTCGILI